MDIKGGLIDWLTMTIGKAKVHLQAGTLSAANTRSGKLENVISIEIREGKASLDIYVTEDQVTVWNQKKGKVIFTDFPEGYKEFLEVPKP